MTRYVVTLYPCLPNTLSVSRVGDVERDIPVAGPTLLAAADAILSDYAGRKLPLADAMAFVALAFGDLGERGTLNVTVREETVARFCDAARRVA